MYPTSGEYDYLPIERAHFGLDAIVKLGSELERLGSTMAFVITGRTITKSTDLVRRLEQAAGTKLAGTFSGIGQHAPQSDIIEATRQAKTVKADSLISLGGGSPIDSTKVVVKELSDNFTGRVIPHIAIPTTLSAAEFSHSRV